VLVAGLLAADGSSALASAGACAVVWKVAPSVVVPGAELHAVAADAPDDAWAVGGPSNLETGPRPPALVEHWDGNRWDVVPTPAHSAVLLGVTATSRSDAWAVGGGGSGAVIEHWDGTHWSRVPSPGLHGLSAVTATSATDAWAVGKDKSGAAVLIHWDGSGWQTLLRRPGSDFRAVAALAPDDVWVVGDVPSFTVPRFLELHWNGQKWSAHTQPVSNPRSDYDPELTAIAVQAKNDIWTAGDAQSDGDGRPYTVLFHWTGTGWRRVLTPQNKFVDALVSRVPGELWLSGSYGNGDGYGLPFLERRVGTTWQPGPLGGGESIDGLATNETQGLWAVGFVGTSFEPNLGFPTHSRSLIKEAQCS
jgi:hypothetical protein